MKNLNPIDDELVTTDQVGNILKIKKTKVFDLLKTGELERIKIGRSTRVRLKDCLRLVSEGTAR